MLMFAYVGEEGAKGSCLRNHSLEKKMLNNLHKFFQGRNKSLESCYLLYGTGCFTLKCPFLNGSEG